jgi:branched-subunit amino acid ABC-type transport system permease component
LQFGVTNYINFAYGELLTSGARHYPRKVTLAKDSIPILMGFNTPAAVKRAARLADILNPHEAR